MAYPEQQNTIDTAPVFAPDGSVRQIPYQQLRDALNSGGKLAVQMKAPNGDVHYVPHDQIGAASQAGGKVNSDQGTISEPKPAEGFWHSLGSVFGLTPEALRAEQEKAAQQGPLKYALSSLPVLGSGHPAVDMVKSAITNVPPLLKKSYSEDQKSVESLRQGDIKGFLAHQIGMVGYGGAAAVSPVLGDAPAKAGEQLGQGNIKGGLGTATGLIAPVVAGGVAKSAPKVAAIASDALDASAKADLGKVLAPTKQATKYIAQKTVIPGMQERGIVSRSGQALQERAATEMEAAGQKIDAAYDALPEGATIATKPVIDALENYKENFVNKVPQPEGGVKSVVLDKGAMDNINEMQDLVREHGDTIDAQSLRQLRQYLDQNVSRAKGYQGTTLAEGQKIDVQRVAANSIRSELAKSVPGLADVNADFNFWKNLHDVMEQTNQRRVGQQGGGLGRKIATGVGASVGAAVHGPAGAFVGAETGNMLSRLFNSTAWNTAKAALKTKLSDALAAKDPEAINSAASEIMGQTEAAQPQAAAEEPPATDRRSNLDLREAIDKMSPEDQVKAIYQSAKTDLPNKRAFDWAENTRGPAKVIGMSDADGLKAMNDKHGYAAGDALLKAKADALKEAGLEAFHDKGDEFLFRGDSPEDMAAKLDKAKDILQNKVIEFKDSQGNVRHFSGAQFSYGTGSDLASAEAALKLNKSGRKASGAAAGRGEMGSITEQTGTPTDINELHRRGIVPPEVTAKADYSGQTVPAKAPTFFSKAEQVAEEKLPNTMKTDQVISTLKNAGVKADELKWLGLDDYLTGKQAVSKADLLDHIRQNNLQVKEVLKGNPDTPQADAILAQMKEKYGTNSQLELMRKMSREELAKYQNTLDSEKGITKFSQYQLPGGENYRELLLQLPPGKTMDAIAAEKGYGGWTSSLTDAQKAEVEKAYDAQRMKATGFQSGHFDEPNVLAHVRFNDRISPDGKKTLFLEELQSDWHQKGRKQGYIGQTIKPEDLKVENNVIISPDGQRAALPKGFNWDLMPDKKSMLERWAKSFNDTVSTANRVPDAPFKSTWHELAMKRMLRYAAENGYDQLSWTTGEQQAARYDLSKHVSNVTYKPSSQTLMAQDLNGGEVLREKVAPEKIADYIGKDAAEKLANIPLDQHGEQTLKGEGLKVGGRGMAGFYDKILPDFMNKYGKKWGAKVGEDTIGDQVAIVDKSGKEVWSGSRNKMPSLDPGDKVIDDNKVHSVPITPAMRKEVIFKGQPIAKGESPLKDLYNRSRDSFNAARMSALANNA